MAAGLITLSGHTHRSITSYTIVSDTCPGTDYGDILTERALSADYTPPALYNICYSLHMFSPDSKEESHPTLFARPCTDVVRDPVLRRVPLLHSRPQDWDPAARWGVPSTNIYVYTHTHTT